MGRAVAINHVTVIVDDLAAGVQFYSEQLGLEKLPAFDLDFPVQFFRVNDHQQLHVTEWKDTPSFRGHVCFEVDDFTAVFNRMKALGAIDTAPWGLVRRLPDGAMQMFVRDPAGNLLEINCPSTVEVDEAIFRDALVENEASTFESGRDDRRGERGLDATLYPNED